jgi:hypothetical protein
MIIEIKEIANFYGWGGGDAWVASQKIWHWMKISRLCTSMDGLR